MMVPLRFFSHYFSYQIIETLLKEKQIFQDFDAIPVSQVISVTGVIEDSPDPNHMRLVGTA